MVTIGFAEKSGVFSQLRTRGKSKWAGLAGHSPVYDLTAVWLIAIVVIVLNACLLYSRTGRALYAIREMKSRPNPAE
jgi:ABC-type branched-subunit amino acid transport system permease subunit